MVIEILLALSMSPERAAANPKAMPAAANDLLSTFELPGVASLKTAQPPPLAMEGSRQPLPLGGSGRELGASDAKPICSILILEADPGLDPDIARSTTPVDQKMVLQGRCAAAPRNR